MNNDMLIEVDGRKIPVAKVKHWRFSPQDFVPFRSELETAQWTAFNAQRTAWQTLEVGPLADWLSHDFAYGSYWVKSQTLNRRLYRCRRDAQSVANDHASLTFLHGNRRSRTYLWRLFFLENP